MGMIRIYSGKSKPANRKPGWRQQEQEYATWLAGVKSTKLFDTKPKTAAKKINPVVGAAAVDESRLNRLPSRVTPGGSAGKQVARPDILYKDNPELLKRELEARSRKFATAPAYNKGGDVLVTDEMMRDITAGKTRRR